MLNDVVALTNQFCLLLGIASPQQMGSWVKSSEVICLRLVSCALQLFHFLAGLLSPRLKSRCGVSSLMITILK